jgi:glycosyltransferase involved in cell wall biosynthesis
MLSIVSPVYRSATLLREFYRRLSETLLMVGDEYEIILVEDCGGDNSWEIIEDLVRGDPRVRGIRLSRNYGQHNALLCGIRAARGEIIVTLDDDLQNPPAGKVSTFRAFRTHLREAFDQFRGPTVNIDVLLTWSTSRFVAVTVRQDARAEGESGYTLRKLISHAMNMMTGFSTVPLQLASMVGFFFSIIGLLSLLFVIGRYLIEGRTVPGFAFLASIISIFSGVQLFALGIFGEYLARMHFRSMERPTYYIRDRIGTS